MKDFFAFDADTRISFEIVGNRSATPAVLLHGFGASRETWNDIESFLSTTAQLCKLPTLNEFE